MKKSFSIRLDAPCRQDFDQMPRTGNAMYCGSCQKNVIDFSAFSEAELIRFFSSPGNGQVCGRFRQEQLNQKYILSEERAASPFRPAYLLLLGLLYFKLPVAAQLKAQPRQEIKKAGTKKKMPATPTPTSMTICGKVTGPGAQQGLRAQVYLVGNNNSIRALADSTGNYEIKIPLTALTDSFRLVFQALGYQEKAVDLRRAQIPGTLNVALEVHEQIVRLDVREVTHLGGVSIVQVEPLRFSRWQRFKWRIRRLFN